MDLHSARRIRRMIVAALLPISVLAAVCIDPTFRPLSIIAIFAGLCGISFVLWRKRHTVATVYSRLPPVVRGACTCVDNLRLSATCVDN